MKILLAGLGSIGQRHARNLRALLGDRVELLAYRVRGRREVITEGMTLDASQTVEERYGIRAFDDLDAALRAGPCAVIVCNPTRFHVETAARAVHAGCHVFIEKPLSDSEEGVEELIACAERRRLVAMVGYQMRFHPALQQLRDWLRQDRIGPIVRVDAEWSEYLPDAHPYEDYRESYAARRDLGGGVILSYIHEFDYLCWLFGTPRRVTATGGRSGAIDVDVEDWAIADIDADRDGRSIAIQLRLSFAKPGKTRTCVVTGTRGSIALDLIAPSLEWRPDRGEIVRDTFDGFVRNDMFLDELRAFLSAIDGGDPVVSARESAVSLRAALAARQSIAEGRPVEIQ